MSVNLIPPFELVAKALSLDENELGAASAMGETPNWDSLGHIEIILALEDNYGILIADNEIEKYSNMTEIVSLYNSIVQNQKI